MWEHFEMWASVLSIKVDNLSLSHAWIQVKNLFFTTIRSYSIAHSLVFIDGLLASVLGPLFSFRSDGPQLNKLNNIRDGFCCYQDFQDPLLTFQLCLFNLKGYNIPLFSLEQTPNSLALSWSAVCCNSALKTIYICKKRVTINTHFYQNDEQENKRVNDTHVTKTPLKWWIQSGRTAATSDQ